MDGNQPPPFKLLNLPILVLMVILKMTPPCEILNLSLLSRKMQRLIKTSKLGMDSSILVNCFTTTSVSVSEKRDPNVAVDRRGLVERITDKDMGWFFQIIPSWIERMEHLMRIFNPELELVISTNCGMAQAQETLAACQMFEKCGIKIYDCSNDVTSLVFRNLPLKTKRLFTFHTPRLPDFNTIFETKQFDFLGLSYMFKFPVILSQMLSLNAVLLEVYDADLNKDDVISLLNAWIRNKWNQTMKNGFIRIKETYLPLNSYEAIMREIPHQVNNNNNHLERPADSETWTTWEQVDGTFIITQSNGRQAKVQFCTLRSYTVIKFNVPN